ncbi:hypothetical protein HOK68_03690 [Candidatus Woesearchaeota archaeon]|jgi:hypothetical protein|nr:hypothetical protein [Candidatus Woesearchaeota archaeon]MBT4388002.1 hypothetical protein [Candidatus Woesearchaeota archaeon]MBT4595346.1 hypothetical protein [Candidatus Woesearchaeota archaeon]MBT5741249.1 hypothetical protein [Candidatus Woesearchaeota archaeon]MBT6505855.1 hypothetical protein [Candidatus Woesearchaeota archaeon]
MNIKRSLMDYPIGYKDYDKLGRESYKFSDSISLEHLSEFDLNAWNAGDWQTPMFKDMELSENLLFLTQVFYGDLTSKSYLISLDRPVSFHSEFRTTYPFKIEEDKLKFKIPVISKFQLLDTDLTSRPATSEHDMMDYENFTKSRIHSSILDGAYGVIFAPLSFGKDKDTKSGYHTKREILPFLFDDVISGSHVSSDVRNAFNYMASLDLIGRILGEETMVDNTIPNSPLISRVHHSLDRETKELFLAAKCSYNDFKENKPFEQTSGLINGLGYDNLREYLTIIGRPE